MPQVHDILVFLCFWLAVARLAFMIISPLVEETREDAIKQWAKEAAGALSGIVIATYFGYVPPAWASREIVSIALGVAAVIGLAITLRKPRQS